MRYMLKCMLLTLIFACLAMMAFAEEPGLAIITDRATDISQGPGNAYPKSGVFSRESFVYTGICVSDSNGNLWHNALRGEWEMWINAADATVMYNGSAMPEEYMLKTIATVNLRSGPGHEYELLATLDAGEQLICIGEYKPYPKGSVWYMVSLENGAAWLNSRFAAPVNN